MPEEGVELLKHSDILSYNEILDVVNEGVSLGIKKIRITGGEPLVRKGVIELVQKIANIKGIVDFGMTTNGILLQDYALELKKAGLHRINISLDTINPEKFKKITRWGNIEDVIRGIEAAKSAGLHPIKINCVITKHPNEPDALEVTEFCKTNGLEIRFIRQMNLKTGEFWQIHGGNGGNCGLCNRLRLTSNGFIKPCLFSEIGFNVREWGVREAILRAIREKPVKGTKNQENHFNNIGG
jgi:cyclic pyranopterin phosphate synthase